MSINSLDINGSLLSIQALPIVVVAGRFRLHYGDLTDSSGLTNIIDEIRPTEIYNLAAQSNVKVSQNEPISYIQYYTIVDAFYVTNKSEVRDDED